MSGLAPTGEDSGHDWTCGCPALAYQQCGGCGQIWYFRRSFCPHCGSERVAVKAASGRGTVYATTLVSRAPSEALRAFVPYKIILVDAEEGFRVMAHGERELVIGDSVTAQFRSFGPLLIPYFERRQETARPSNAMSAPG